MKWIKLIVIVLLLAAVTQNAAQSQTGAQEERDHPRNQNDPNRDRDGEPYDDGFGDRYGDQYGDRYGDPYGDDDRYGGYGDRYRPRSPRREVGFFYDELLPYGNWVLTRQYGWAWFPNDVRPSWRPYSEGRWMNSDYGWTWVTYEPFGWATYHYGRWAWDPRFGWLWVPGTIWGPAWVSWQNGGGYVGWAPLPPSVGFEVGIGIRLGGLDLSVGIRPDSYSFVPERSFLEARISGFLEPAGRSRTIFRSTRNITNYSYSDNRVVNRGVDIERIERATGRQVQSLRISSDPRAKTRTEVSAGELRIFRPERRQLDSVEVGPSTNRGERAEAPPPQGWDNGRNRPGPNRDNSPDNSRDNRPDQRRDNRPGTQRDGADMPDFQVAPRPEGPQLNEREIEKKQQRAQQELRRFQLEEQRNVEKAQKQELNRTKAVAERAEVQKRQLEERAALKQVQQDAAQQLKERQKALREAGRPPAPPAQDEQKPENDKDKNKNKGRGPGKGNGGGRSQ